MINFQAMSSLSGQAYEDVVKMDLEARGHTNIKENVDLDDIGIEIDFLIDDTYVECKGGYNGKKKRPGAKRTDNVKKSIANGALLKSVIPDCKYIVYFSSKPVPGSFSDKMISLALDKNIIDQVRYLGYSGSLKNE